MTNTKRMQRPYYEGAPPIVREKVAMIMGPFSRDTLPTYDILFVEQAAGEVAGLDFDGYGYKGTHFFLKPYDAARYRLKHRRKKVKWADLPGKTQTAILAYLETE